LGKNSNLKKVRHFRKKKFLPAEKKGGAEIKRKKAHIADVTRRKRDDHNKSAFSTSRQKIYHGKSWLTLYSEEIPLKTAPEFAMKRESCSMGREEDNFLEIGDRTTS